MAERTMRTMLRRLGIGNFNITGCIPFLFIAPATTDPKSPPVMMMAKHLQRVLNELGARVPVTGYLNQPTARALAQVLGPDWMSMSWADNIRAVLRARDLRRSLAPVPEDALEPPPAESVGFFDLPDVPGGVVTYAIAGYLLYRHLSKGRRA